MSFLHYPGPCPRITINKKCVDSDRKFKLIYFTVYV